jgi:Carboxylesterase type B
MPFGAASLAEAEAAGEALLKTGATLEGQPMTTIAEARALDAEKLQEMFPPRGMANVVLDGYFMEESADAVFEKGEQAQVPLLAGWNSLEGHPASFFAMYGDKLTFEKVVELIKARFGDMTEEILAAYGIASLEDVFSQKGIDFASDLFTGFPTWKACDYHATTCDKPVYRYKFFRARPEEHPAPGAVHSADIEYAMGNLATNKVYDWQDEDYAISKLFLNFYANFCKNGDPNGEGLPEWTPINGNLDAAPVMRIDVESAESADPAVENAYRTLEKFYRKSL